MNSILLNKKDLIRYGKPGLLNIIKIKPFPKTNKDIGVVLLIPTKQFKYVNNLLDVKKKISYINSDIFIQTISDIFYIIYDKENKIIEIVGEIETYDQLKHVLESIYVYAPSETFIWSGMVSRDNCNKYIKLGFDNPYIAQKSPILKYKCNSSMISFFKYNKNTKIDVNSVKNKLKYITEIDGNTCSVNIRFTTNAIKYLKKINGPKSTNEQSGALSVTKVTDDMVFELGPDPNSINSGAEEEVDAVWSRYNFHTHPPKAYKNNNVVKGWPSSQDYVGFLQLNNHTICHTVVTMEGLYIISFSHEWDKNIKNIDHNYILDDYDIDHKSDISFDQYVDKINSKTYKHTGKKLFNVKFMLWEMATKQFSVYYYKTNNKCLATEENFKFSSDYEWD